MTHLGRAKKQTAKKYFAINIKILYKNGMLYLLASVILPTGNY